MTDLRTTQIAVEEWSVGTPRLQLTQIVLEEWAAVQTVTPQLVLTKVVLEQWASVAVVAQINRQQIAVAVNVS